MALDDTETYDAKGARAPHPTLTLLIQSRTGERVEVPMSYRLEAAEEVSIYEAGGALQRFAQDFLDSKKAAS